LIGFDCRYVILQKNLQCPAPVGSAGVENLFRSTSVKPG